MFLKGPRLAGLLKNMVVKGLVVTLVLDCCFSATVYRNSDSSVRYLPFGPRHSLDHENSLAGRNTRSANRDASMRDNWLLHPDQYAILAACGPDENAKGGSEASEKEVTYGALSYFLSQALSAHGLGKRHKDIHRHLCARFRETCVVQHPVLYGNADQGFFGRVSPHSGMRSICIIEREGCLQLLAGQAHGLRDGDQFRVSPTGSTSGTNEGSIAKVIRVGALTSQLELLGHPRNLRTGWIAEPLTLANLANFPITLATDLPQHDELLAALEERSLGTHINSYQVPALQVVLNHNDEYEMLDDSGRKVINLPLMPREQTDTRRICDVLEHLARFRMVKDLTNQTPTAAFRNSFDVRLIRDRAAFKAGDQIQMGHGSKVQLAITNMGDTTIYAHVYNLGPLWRVKGILHATYSAIPPQKDPRNGEFASTGKWAKMITMTIPPIMRVYGSCEDIIKVFVASQPTSLDLLELPNLGEIAKIIAGNRVSHPNRHVSEDWVALNFHIRIVR